MEKYCPCCPEVELRRAVRRGVEIDYCPDCNGIWLDNGELNKIVAESIEASGEENSPAATSNQGANDRKSVFKSFLNLMGSTKDEADEIIDDDFITKKDDA